MDRFVIGTGRCGSTLLSRMLAENRSLLMIFELFSGLDRARRFAPWPVPGRELAGLLSEATPAVTLVMRRGFEIAEVVYPFREGCRYRRDGAIPWMAAATLPRMSDEPDRLLDDVIAFSERLPEQHLSSHYRALFDWLARRMGRSTWIEKSGSSIEYLGALHEFFPGARFLHLHRSGPETALSMREHAVYRLWVSLLFGSGDPSAAANPDPALLDPEAEPAPDDAITRMLDSRPPVELFGRYWTDLVARGFRTLGRLDARQYREIRFEDLVSRPRETLREISAFFELEDDPGDWIDRAAGLVRGIPPARFDKLGEDEQTRLADACRPAQQLLGRL